MKVNKEIMRFALSKFVTQDRQDEMRLKTKNI